ncbi:Uncharacterised protein [Streptococcus merionis]|uniref:Uncharacterized protein n=2 Tax=Streptococcus merionis TaxID=400065 RepID=A0A239SSD5_9STRE|nr:Uncharacterised protein [Streptococcus merionis]
MEYIGWITLGLVLLHLSYPERVRRLERKVKPLLKENKGEQDMSQIIQKLVNTQCKITFEEIFGSEEVYEILEADEEWLKISRELKGGKSETRIVRIDNIKEIKPLG